MADVVLVAPIRLSNENGLQRITGVAGEAITAGHACYIAADGLIWESISTIAIGGQFDGVAVADAAAGSPVTIFQEGYRIRIGAHGIGIGSFLYTSDTKGLFSDASIPTPVLEQPIAMAVSATEIMVTRMDRPPALNP